MTFDRLVILIAALLVIVACVIYLSQHFNLNFN